MAEQEKVLSVKAYTRTIQQKAVTFVCEYCGQTVTELRHPNGKVKYCNACRLEANNAKRIARINAKRAQK